MDRSVVVRLRAEVAEFKRGMSEAAASVGQVTTKAQDVGRKGAQGFSTLLGWVDKNEQSVSTLTTQLGLVSVGLVSMAGLAVKKFADFDQAMSNVAATGQDATQNITALRDAAIDAGARTVYSATEAAGAVEMLAKAGISAADILGGGLDGALDLAAAGELAVADAAEIAASALTQFNLGGDRARHVADLLAAGAGKAQGGVADLGQALNQSGLVANQMGLSVEETTGTLTAFANAGLIGSDAGTSFRAMLLRLANPTKESADLMAELGINAYDAQGDFVGMESVAGQLQDRLGGLTQEQRNAALATIFGQDAIRSASILYSEGADGVAEWTDAVDESGYAARVAATRLDNLKGDFEALSGSLDTVFLQSGAGANDVLRQIVQGAEAVVDAIGEIPGPVLSAITILVGTAGLVGLGVAGMGKLAVAVSNVKTALDTMKISARTAGIAASVAAGVLAAGAIALTVWATNAAEAKARTEEFQNTLDEFGTVTDATMDTINSALSRDTNNWIDNIFGDDPRSLIDMADDLGIAVEDLQGYILGEADALDRVTQATEAYVEANSGSRRDQKDAENRVRALTGGLNEQADALTDAQKAAIQKAEADEEAGLANVELAQEYETTTGTIEGQTRALADLISAQREASGIVASELEAQAGLQQAYDDAAAAVKENGETLNLNTQQGRDNQAQLLGISDAAFELAESMEAAGAPITEVRDAMADARANFIDAAESMGMSTEKAEALADKLGLIPEDINTTIEVSDEEAKVRADRFVAAYSNRTLPMTIKVLADLGSYNAAQRQAYSDARSKYSTGGYALGGAVFGPGTETSDSIPARLSRNEHVWTASEVRGAGGHAAVESLRAGARAGRLSARYAKGGPVAPGFATGGHMGGLATAVPASASSAAAAFPSFPDTVRLDAQSVQAVADAIVAGSERVASGVLSTAARSSAATRSTGRATR